MISEKELREAARRYEKALLADLPEPEDCPATFSPAFERKMKKLILRTDHPVRFWTLRLLPVLLAAGIAAALLLPKAEEEPVPPPEPPASVEPAAPAPEVPAEPVEPEVQETIVYRPTWMPEGCVWDREAIYDNEGMTVYQTPGGGEAVFFYDLTGGQEEQEGVEVTVGDGTGTLLSGRKGESSELFWSADGVSFWLAAPFTGEDMVRVAESVEKDTAS